MEDAKTLLGILKAHAEVKPLYLLKLIDFPINIRGQLSHYFANILLKVDLCEKMWMIICSIFWPRGRTNTFFV